MATLSRSSNTITLNVVRDLDDTSQLKDLLTKDTNPVFSIASELGQFAGQAIKSAVGSAPAKVTVRAPANWKTSTGFGFSLSPTESCSIAIGDKSTKFSVAKSIGSSETEDLFAGPFDGKVYINIDLDFGIEGSVTGSGSVSGIGIAGKACGSATATLSYCHPVDAETETCDAVKEAFSNLVFPFEPNCALVMVPGSIGKVNFDGTLGCELDISYGFGSYKFSAPGVDKARQSLQVGLEKFSAPSVDIETGAKAAFTYEHSDHFGAIIKKSEAQTAQLYLVRSAKNETGMSIGVTVGISACGNINAHLDKNRLVQAVNKITGGGGDKIATLADQLQSGLVSKSNDWLSNQQGEAGLLFSLSKQANRALLFAFKADLSNVVLAKQSWEQFARGDLKQAVRTGGMMLMSGSGVADELRKSTSIDLHFFNLFSVKEITTYFQNSYVQMGPDGSVRFLYDIGKEQEVETRNAMKKSRIHFVAGATGGTAGEVQNAEVDLNIELSETNNSAEANKIVDSIGSIPPTQAAQAAQTAMRQFVNSNKKGALNLILVLKPSAYLRLACSQYTGADHHIAPALPQDQDRNNWKAFQEASETLLQLSFVGDLTFFDWQQFNLICNGKTSGVPDRRHPGNPNTVPPSFFGNLQNLKGLVVYYYLSGAQFMNLCDDLHALAGAAGEIKTETQWGSMLATLTGLVKSDVNNDWSKPAARATLGLCSGAAVSTNLQSKEQGFTCTLTLS